VAAKEKTLLEHVPLGADCYSLYVHIPFCPTICLYCTFASSPAVLWKKRSEEYMMALASELRAKKEQMEETGCRCGPVTVYVGGGTPTTLTAEELDRLLSLIEETYDLSAALEYTVEAGRPDSITADKLAVMLAHGVTRISVNPQTMNDVTLERIGRRHSAGETEEAFYLAREAGFTNINMDIILGLPGEGMPEVERTLRRIERLRPDSLTVHSLAIKRASRLRLNILEDRQKDTEADRGDFRGLAMDNSSGLMQLAAESAGRMDMSPYYLYRQKNMRGNLENTGFAREGCECLYNILIMEEVQTICAVGAGASTKTVSADGRIERTVNPKDVDLYIRRMAPFEKTCDGKNR
jgi:oxygen-independent coproporphyrinogen-3 oxidase